MFCLSQKIFTVTLDPVRFVHIYLRILCSPFYLRIGVFSSYSSIFRNVVANHVFLTHISPLFIIHVFSPTVKQTNLHLGTRHSRIKNAPKFG